MSYNIDLFEQPVSQSSQPVGPASGRRRSGDLVLITKRRRIDEIGDESRRRILDAAEALFGERGFDRTSLADVARRSGISRGSIPWHFGDKNGLLVAVYERAVDRFLAEQDPPASGALPIREVIERAEEWLQRPAAAMFNSTMTAALTPGDPIHDHLVKFLRGVREQLATAIRASFPRRSGAAAAAAAEVDATHLAGVINGAFIGLHLQHHLDPTFDMAGAMRALILMVERKLGIAGGAASS